MTTLWASFKIYIIAGAVAILLAGIVWFGAHERAIGAAGVQAKWDKATAAQSLLATAASESARTVERNHATYFADIDKTYLETTTHEYPTIAAGLPAAIAAHTLKLRDNCTTLPSRDVSRATTSSRELDEAYTSALSKRAEAEARAIRIVGIGDEADSRERVLGAQVTALQDVLRAERKP